MRVAAKTGLKVPKEGNPREYIEDTPVEVPDTTYYRRLIADGSLVQVPAVPAVPEVPAAPAKPAKGATTDGQ